jgi:hypothetical protein
MTEEKVKQEVEKRDEKQIWCSAATNRAAIVWMIGADLSAGAHLGKENPEVLLQSAVRFFKFLSGEERQKFVHHVTEKAS